MRNLVTRRVVFALATVSLMGGAFFACSTDSPTAPGPPGGGGPPPPDPGTWNISVTADPAQLQLPPPGQPVPTSSILIEVRRASDNAPPPTGATITVAATRGTINGVDSGVFTLTNGRVTLTFTPTEAGTADVQARLEGSAGQASILVAGVEDVETFVLSHVTPDVVDPAGGQTLTIVGQGIREPVRVSIGGIDAEVLSVEPTRIRVRVPARPGIPVGSRQTVSVAVTSGLGTPFQATDSLTNVLTYDHDADPFLLSHVSPNVVDPAGGEVVDIFGRGIHAPARVNIGGVDSEVLLVTSDRIRVRVPPRPGVPVGSTEAVNISVTSGVGTDFQTSDSLTGALTYAHGGTIIRPEIFSVTPTTGPNEGGTEVTIRGTGFQSPVQVLFESAQASLVEAEPISVTSSEIRVRTPPARSFGQGNLNQAVSITVINLESGFRTTREQAFRYGVVIQITGITPMRGPFTGGTTITVHGIGFQAPVAVILGGIEQQVLSVSGSQLLFRTVAAASAPGCGALAAAELEVVNLGMPPLEDSRASFTGFQFEGPPDPIITGIFPSNGPQTGGFDVTITGAGFENPVRVQFGEQTSPDAAANLAGNQVVAEAPAFTGTFETEVCFVDGVEGTRLVPTSVDVQVTNQATNCVATSAKAFAYIPADTSCNVAPPEPSPPTADFEFGGQSASMTVGFVDASTGNPTSWSWSFGDGTTSFQRNPTKTYSDPGTYAVSLTVSNADGSDTRVKQVTVPLP